MTTRRLTISGPGFAMLLNSVLEKGVSAKFKVTGQSMLPNICNNDVVTISPYLGNEPEIGEVIALMETGCSRIIIHRILEKKGGLFLIKGDSLYTCDGLFSRECIVGYVSQVQRDFVSVPVNRIRSSRIRLLSKFRIFCLVRIFSRGNWGKLGKKIEGWLSVFQSRH